VMQHSNFDSIVQTFEHGGVNTYVGFNNCSNIDFNVVL
jgi:hypothetical protein